MTGTVLLIVLDIISINLALVLAFYLRFDGAPPPGQFGGALGLAPMATVIYLVLFYFFRLYQRLWQYAGVSELLSIVLAALAGSAVNVSIAYFRMAPDIFPLPRTIFIIWTVFLILFVGLSRLSWRLFREYRRPVLSRRRGQAVLIIGAGDTGAMVARELRNRKRNGGEPVGFVDDDPAKQGRQINSLPVLGTREDISHLVKDFNVSEIVIATPAVKGKVVREIVDICHSAGARLSIVPAIHDLLDGKVNVEPVREVRVEDVLGREPVRVDLEAIAGYVCGEVVLITGAGGSIGSELCRQIACFGPKQLILLGHGENSIYQIHQELSREHPEITLVQSIADVKDRAAVDHVFRNYAPGVVFHTAAHKHVPLMEINPSEAFKNNVLGTHVVASAADRCKSKVFILISTDKAVNPASVMGASKRVAEMVVQRISKTSDTRFAAVRFGNVLGSRGSVVPLFRKQIAEGGPVTVTHPEMTRFFMTIPEAVQLVIQAGAIARGGEIFALDMGEPVKILDLADSMIILSGLEPGKDIDICFTGIRPGEKLHEEILTEAEDVGKTKHHKIYAAKPESFDYLSLEQFLIMLSRPDVMNYTLLEDLLYSIIPGFKKDKIKLFQVS
ncbi:MAG: UDP-N-acetyl-alpha-D-glucosamine C6 dehydratase [Pelotomaculum sp. PtaU1.Bin065]|nr:MAG: UDP-N-acetyl-alpha-D-glucosamine C6 dehydratase [Pelotomaculum sp. PtaU1.Bin065]